MSPARATSPLWLIIIAFWDGSVPFGHWTQCGMSGMGGIARMVGEWARRMNGMGV